MTKKLVDIDLVKIKPNPGQPRKTFPEDSLRELMTSVKKHGILQPVLVRDRGSFYEIISGERRFQAAKRLNFLKIPCIVENVADADSLEIAIIENLHRQDLNPYEKAQSFKALMTAVGYTQEKLAQMLGFSRSAVANTLRLLDLPQEAVEMLKSGRLTEGHARAILACKAIADQKKLLARIMQESLSVRMSEKAAGRLNSERRQKGKMGPTLNFEVQDIVNKLRDILGTKVTFTGSTSKGKLEIEFYSEEELESIIDQILKKH